MSIQDVYGLVPRYPQVTIRAKTLTGRTIEFTTKDFLARVFQHEIDHTNGKLFIDRIKNNRYYLLGSKGKLEPLTEEEVKRRHLVAK